VRAVALLEEMHGVTRVPGFAERYGAVVAAAAMRACLRHGGGGVALHLDDVVGVLFRVASANADLASVARDLAGPAVAQRMQEVVGPPGPGGAPEWLVGVAHGALGECSRASAPGPTETDEAAFHRLVTVSRRNCHAVAVLAAWFTSPQP